MDPRFLPFTYGSSMRAKNKREKQGFVTYSTDRENKVSIKIFIISYSGLIMGFAPHPSGNSNLAPYFYLKTFSFAPFNPLLSLSNLEFPMTLCGGGTVYTYFLELHIPEKQEDIDRLANFESTIVTLPLAACNNMSCWCHRPTYTKP